MCNVVAICTMDGSKEVSTNSCIFSVIYLSLFVLDSILGSREGDAHPIRNSRNTITKYWQYRVSIIIFLAFQILVLRIMHETKILFEPNRSRRPSPHINVQPYDPL